LNLDAALSSIEQAAQALAYLLKQPVEAPQDDFALGRVVCDVLQTLSLDIAYLGVIQGDMAHVCATFPHSASHDGSWSFSLNNTLTGWALEKNDLVAVTSLQANSSLDGIPHVRHRHTRSFVALALPMGDLRAFLSINGFQERPAFTEPERDLIRDLATYLCLSNQRLLVNACSAVSGLTIGRDAELELRRWLPQAILLNQLHLRYQPYWDLQTSSVAGVEALLRWERPGAGNVDPMTFIPIAERTGAIVELGDWVRAHAFGWAAKNLPAGKVLGVNVSSLEILRDFPDRLFEDLRHAGLEPGRVVLEITETAALHLTSRVIDSIQACVAMGVRIAIDDFGTGYATMDYLRALPVHVVKMHRSVVEMLPESGTHAAMAKSIMALARDIGADVIAEGVENVRQMV
jgi:EAL domain-containing protein (putative c-di-GMP-specific phosphodiesterase class I)